MVLHLDIAPTILEMAGIKKPSQMQGTSFLPLLKSKETKWRDKMFYEYYWEDASSHTPTSMRLEQTDTNLFVQKVYGILTSYLICKKTHTN